MNGWSQAVDRADRAVVVVAFSVNDPDNGFAHDHCSAIHFDEFGDSIELEHECWLEREQPVFRYDAVRSRIRVGRRWFAIAAYRSWFGNWCWDAAAMSREEARRLAAYALERGYRITATVGETDLLPASAE